MEDKLLQLQELMLEKNIVIRALPKELEYRHIYTGVNEYKKTKYDRILRTNPTARLETTKSENQYIIYKEQTEFQKDRFIIGIADNVIFQIDWVYDEDDNIVIFNSLENVLDYIKEM